ncbi:MAG: Ig-like domain-containing protein [Melioribacteraceae bacterium]|nr:Ig-like domain-containing protein [Melioribacteraceae bacterium]
MNKLKNNLLRWLIPLLIIIMITGCEDRDGITYPPTTTTPTVSSTNPADGAIEVPFNQQITATFSEEMNSSTITTASFTLMQGTSFVAGTVSYTGTTAAFAPSSNLSPNTDYTATITTTAKNLAGNGLAANYTWTFTTGSAPTVTPPTVSSTAPANTATDVPINQKIAATFSVAMDATTITSSTFTLLQGTTPISGFVSYSGITAIFAPTTDLMPNTVYTGIITTGAADLAGNALENNYVWSFTTGATAQVTPPTVILTDPANAETNVPLNQKVAATFSKTMDASTITSGTFTLRQGTTSVSGFTSYSGTTAIFSPASNLSPNTVYTATITTGAKDLAGNSLANNYVWSFTTGSSTVITPPTIISTDPIDGEIDVSVDKHVTATFSKPMDASTITTAVFTLMEAGFNSFISGTVSYSGTTATFVPLIDLQANTTYTATITTGAKDLTGNSMTNNYVWNFTTASTSYTVSLSSDPAEGGTTNGGGTYDDGASVTVSATPNSGYEFVNWTENGNEVSTNASYTFTINETERW